MGEVVENGALRKFLANLKKRSSVKSEQDFGPDDFITAANNPTDTSKKSIEIRRYIDKIYNCTRPLGKNRCIKGTPDNKSPDCEVNIAGSKPFVSCKLKKDVPSSTSTAASSTSVLPHSSSLDTFLQSLDRKFGIKITENDFLEAVSGGSFRGKRIKEKIADAYVCTIPDNEDTIPDNEDKCYEGDSEKDTRDMRCTVSLSSKHPPFAKCTRKDSTYEIVGECTPLSILGGLLKVWRHVAHIALMWEYEPLFFTNRTEIERSKIEGINRVFEIWSSSYNTLESILLENPPWLRRTITDKKEEPKNFCEMVSHFLLGLEGEEGEEQWILTSYLGGGSYGHVFKATRTTKTGVAQNAAIKLMLTVVKNNYNEGVSPSNEVKNAIEFHKAGCGFKVFSHKVNNYINNKINHKQSTNILTGPIFLDGRLLDKQLLIIGEAFKSAVGWYSSEIADMTLSEFIFGIPEDNSDDPHHVPTIHIPAENSDDPHHVPTIHPTHPTEGKRSKKRRGSRSQSSEEEMKETKVSLLLTRTINIHKIPEVTKISDAIIGLFKKMLEKGLVQGDAHAENIMLKVNFDEDKKPIIHLGFIDFGRAYTRDTLKEIYGDTIQVDQQLITGHLNDLMAFIRVCCIKVGETHRTSQPKAFTIMEHVSEYLHNFCEDRWYYLNYLNPEYGTLLDEMFESFTQLLRSTNATDEFYNMQEVKDNVNDLFSKCEAIMVKFQESIHLVWSS
jgi:hypothetical protein